MADNKTYGSSNNSTLPNGTVVATDEISGVDYQKIKLVDGTAESTTVIPGVSGGLYTQGHIAHDAADGGNPLKTGGKAYNFDGSAPGTAVTEADRANFITDVYGRQFVETAHPNYWDTSADYGAAQTNATVKAAPGAGLKLYITDVIISNGATAGNVTLLDGSGGTVKLEVYSAINDTIRHSFKTPLSLTANTLLALTSTTVTTHSVTVSGYIAP